MYEKIKNGRLWKEEWVTVCLMIINSGLFFIGSWMEKKTGINRLMEAGAMYEPLFLAGQYSRLLTSVFLHFSWNHLTSNMIMLGAAGSILEKETGHIRFLLLYLFSGVCGNILSLGLGLYTGDYAISAGASGAVFGVLGALLVILFKKRAKIGQVSGRGMLLLIVLAVYSGFQSVGVDNAAHIGGVIFGAAAMGICLAVGRKKESLG